MINVTTWQNSAGTGYAKHLPGARTGRWSLAVALCLIGFFPTARPAGAGKNHKFVNQNVPAAADQKSSVEAAQGAFGTSGRKTSIEDLKKAIIEKNIFRPAKSIKIAAPVETAQISFGPDPLKNPFILLGIKDTEGGLRANLSFGKPTLRVEEVDVGYIIDEIISIEAIESTFIRCLYLNNGLEVRIDVGESSADAWKRQASGEIEYKLLGTSATASGGYVAYIIVTNIREKTYRTVEPGDSLGDATVKIIEEGHVLLIDSQGNEISIRNPLSPRY
jgi:hypothetical protein